MEFLEISIHYAKNFDVEEILFSGINVAPEFQSYSKQKPTFDINVPFHIYTEIKILLSSITLYSD